jgi:hypothetical protein
VIYGDAGNDYIRGEDGDDIVYAGTGDDVISGGLGYDVLYGDGGMDGLIGGPGTGDFLVGGSDSDRYLVFANDTISGLDSQDARILFRNNLNQWTTGEMEVVDVPLQKLHARVDNARLLKDSLSADPIVFEKVSTLPNAASTRNVLSEFVTNQYNPATGMFDKIYTYERKIQFSDWDELNTAANKLRESRTYFEFGNNWNSTQEIKAVVPTQQYLWTEFLQESNWINEEPLDFFYYQQSNDGEWWYRTDAKFASTFDYMNPESDWSSIWQVAFDDALAAERGTLVLKLNLVNRLFSSLS